MVKHYSEQLDRTFFAISDPTRRAIIGNLAAKGQCSVLELAQPFNMSLPAISKHLKLLENANLITRERKGRVHYLKLRGEPMAEANEWLVTYTKFWGQRLDALEQYLIDTAQGEENEQQQNHSDGNSHPAQDSESPD
jgi:DNA-binding transcriptional ArsR family regulator